MKAANASQRTLAGRGGPPHFPHSSNPMKNTTEDHSPACTTFDFAKPSPAKSMATTAAPPNANGTLHLLRHTHAHSAPIITPTASAR
jgi:hypothetical protein